LRVSNAKFLKRKYETEVDVRERWWGAREGGGPNQIVFCGRDMNFSWTKTH